MDARLGGKRRGARGHAIRLGPPRQLAQRARALDQAPTLIRVDRLAGEAVGDRGCARQVLRRRVAGENHADRRRVPVPNAREQRGPVHARHPHVSHDHVGGLGLERGKRRFSALREVDAPDVSVATQRVAQALEQVRLVVHEQDPLAHVEGGRSRLGHTPSVIA
jgi:hypothetical protein